MLTVLAFAVATLAGLALLAAVDQSGIPTVNGAKGTAGGRSLASQAVLPPASQITFAQTVASLIDQFDNAIVTVVDYKNRKVYVTDDPTQAATLTNAATNSGAAKLVTYTPEPDQESRALTWTAADANDPSQGYQDALTIVDAVKPRRTAASLASAALSAVMGVETPPTDEPLVVVDQKNAVVVLVEDTSGARATAIAGVTLNAGNAAQVDFSEPESASASVPLIFEGGATS